MLFASFGSITGTLSEWLYENLPCHVCRAQLEAGAGLFKRNKLTCITCIYRVTFDAIFQKSPENVKARSGCMLKLSFMLASFTALLSWLCYQEASEEYAYFHQG